MKNERKKTFITLLKRITLIVAFVIWAKILYEVLKFPGGFGAQLPYCLAGTMLTFGIATALYKGLEYWERSS